jgi:hypothetical protein
MSTKINLDVQNGTDFYRIMTVVDNNKNIIDLSTYTIEGQIRKSYSETDYVSFDIIKIDPVIGKISIGLTNQVTNTLTASKYVYDIEITSATGVKYRIAEGLITTSLNVTLAIADSPITVPTDTVSLEVLASPIGSTLVGTIQTGTGAVARTVDGKLKEAVSVKDFGATGDGITDDTVAIQAAVTAAGGGTTFFPAGNYIISATINCFTQGASIVGDSIGTTVIKANHTTGAVFRFYRSFSGIRNIAITAIGSRLTATDQLGFGVQFETEDAPDTTAMRMRCCFCDNVYVVLQPGTAYYWVGNATQGSVMQSCYASGNRGHGYAQDRGILSGRVNLIPSAAGCMTIDTCLFYGSSGHGIVAGAPTDTLSSPSVRVLVSNCEVSGNAQDPAIRYKNTQIYLDGANHEVTTCVMDSSASSGCGGIYFTGRNLWAVNNRYLESVFAVIVGYNSKLASQGVNVEGITCVNNAVANMNPAVIVETGATNVRVVNWLPSNITTIITPNVPGTQLDSVPQIVTKTTDQAISNSATLTDDTELKYPIQVSQKYYFDCYLDFTSEATIDIKIAFTIPSGASLRWSPVNGIKVDTTGTIVSQIQTTVSGTAVSFGYIGAGSRQQLFLQGYVLCGTNAGNLQLQFAQDTAGVIAPATIRTGSRLTVSTALV